MTEVRFGDHCVELRPGESVLDALERDQAPVPSSCRAGACQFCMLRLVEGEVPKSCQEGLKPALRQTGHFLSCICRPMVSLRCELANTAAFRADVEVDEVSMIGPDVARVRFRRPEKFNFNAGQFVTLRRQNGLARSYSLASRSDVVRHFEVHVRRVPQGRLSSWFHDEAKAGDKLWMEGPKGDCMYYPGSPQEPVTLVGTGTGVAPLAAIAEDALRQGHLGPIVLYQGAIAEERLYLVEALSSLALRYQNFRYQRCVMQGAGSPGVIVGDLKEIVRAELSEVQERRLYLCGDPGLVRTLKKQAFLAGISLGRIHADPFVGTEG